MAKIILDRYDIETAIKAYVKDKFLPYGFDEKTIYVTQERVVSAKIMFGEQSPDRTEALPGLDVDTDWPEEELKVTDPTIDESI